MIEFHKLNEPSTSRGAPEPGQGKVSGPIALADTLLGHAPDGFWKQPPFPFGWKG